jgi:D-alanyl-D-alanine carboxypeptidase
MRQPNHRPHIELQLVLSLCMALLWLHASETNAADPLEKELQRALATEVGRQDLPGAIAAVRLAGGPPITVAAGFAERASAIPMEPTHRMLGASIGKTFVAALALALADEGKLALDQRIAHWFGREPWLARLPNGDEITVRMLLNHTSGVPDHVRSSRFLQLRAQGVAADRIFTPLELIGFVLDEAPLFRPGTGFAYSDTNYILAGLILEASGARPVFEAIHERFLLPLALARTNPSNARKLEKLATGYTLAEDAETALVKAGLLLYNPASEWTGGGLVTNPHDLVLWSRALYRGEALHGDYLSELLAPGTREFLPAPYASVFQQYGLGVMLRETAFGRAYGHTGGIPGYSSISSYFPEHDVAVAVMTNRSEGVDRVALERALLAVLACEPNTKRKDASRCMALSR